jgi:hypothetical protein
MTPETHALRVAKRAVDEQAKNAGFDAADLALLWEEIAKGFPQMEPEGLLSIAVIIAMTRAIVDERK